MANMTKRKVNIYLEKGKIVDVKVGSVDNTKKNGVVIVVESEKNVLKKLRLYNIDYGKHFENFDVNEGLIKAFDYSNSYNGNSNFSSNLEILRDFFINNYDRNCLSKDERLEIKKFMFLVYIEAKNKKLL